MIGFIESDLEVVTGWGMLGLLYAILYAIVVLVQSDTQQGRNVIQELAALQELKEKGVLSEEEFQAKKVELLKI